MSLKLRTCSILSRAAKQKAVFPKLAEFKRITVDAFLKYGLSIAIPDLLDQGIQKRSLESGFLSITKLVFICPQVSNALVSRKLSEDLFLNPKMDITVPNLTELQWGLDEVNVTRSYTRESPRAQKILDKLQLRFSCF